MKFSKSPVAKIQFFRPAASRIFIALALTGVLSLSSSASAQVLTYNFNDAAGNTAANSGSATGDTVTMNNATGTATDFLSPYSTGGVAFLDGTGTLNLTSASGMGSAALSGGPYAASSTAGAVFNSAGSFTITGWYNTSVTTSWSSARLLEVGGSFIFFANGPGALVLQLPGSSGNITVLSNSGGSGSAFSTTNTSHWTFMAVTANNLTGQVVFYQGTQAGSSSLLSYTTNYTAGAAILSGFSGLAIGGSVTSGSNPRPFDGSLDDFNVYTATDGSGALSSSQISSILAAQAVPEPSTSFYLGFALLLGFLMMGARRFRNASKSL